MRKFSILVCLGLLLAIQSCMPGTNNLEKSKIQPNIILIMADDLGYGELGSYGQKIIETPNIDKLAMEGMRFTQFYAGSPVCAPSRCILLTGMHSGHAYIRGNDPWAERGDVWSFEAMEQDSSLEGQRPIPDSIYTLAEYLKEEGYATACVGKWGLGAPGSEGDPNKQGFDLFFGYICQRQAHTYYPTHLWKNDRKVMLNNTFLKPHTRLNKEEDHKDPRVYERFHQKDYAPEVMHKEALRFIDENAENPFFLYYASPIPHVPLQAPKRWIDYYKAMVAEQGPYIGNKSYFPAYLPRAGYAAMVSYLDEQVGDILNSLEKNGIAENTIVLFTSDNGPTYNGGTDSEFFDSAGPFLESKGWGKGYLHEGGIRVPLIVKWPGKIRKHSSTDFVAASWDLFPTIVDLLKSTTNLETNGISLLPVLEHYSEIENEREYLYWEFPEYNGQQAIRMGNWKAMRKNMQEGNLEIQLFNLKTDPTEENNIADQYPDIVEKMAILLKKEHRISNNPKFQIAAIDNMD